MKTISVLMSILLFSNIAFCDQSCDWKTGITPGPNKTFVYSEACHLQVGKLVQDSAVKDQQIKDLSTAIDLKNLAINFSDQRATLWQKNSLDAQDRLSKIDSEQKHNDFLYFGLGILSAIGVGFATAKLVGK
jgi:hypothetical protein